MTPSRLHSPIGIGIVGCGRAAEDLHLPAIARTEAVTAVAATDLDPAALARVSARFGIARRHRGINELLADQAVAIAVICTPPATHLEIALAAVAAGKHVLVEKPLTLLPADAERMAAVENAAGVVTAVGLNLRCHRLVEAARAVIAAGALGPVSTLRTTWSAGNQRGRPVPGWRLRRENGGGVLYEVGTHHVDLWRYLLGEEITDVAALCRSGDEDDEAAVLTGRATGGALVSAVLSDHAPGANEVDIVGRDGRLRFSLYRADSFDLTSSAPDYRPAARMRSLARQVSVLPTVVRVARAGGDFLGSYTRQLERLVEAVDGRGAPAATWADGLQAARIVDAAAEASRA